MQGGGRLVFRASWANDDVEFVINTHRLRSHAESADRPFVLNSRHDPPIPRQRLFAKPDLSAMKSDSDRLFLATILDVDEKAYSRDWYDLIRASGLLWQLLLDDANLLSIANRKHGLRFRFEGIPFYYDMPGNPVAYWADLDPEFFPGAKTKTLSRDEFLRMRCYYTTEHRPTFET